MSHFRLKYESETLHNKDVFALLDGLMYYDFTIQNLIRALGLVGLRVITFLALSPQNEMVNIVFILCYPDCE